MWLVREAMAGFNVHKSFELHLRLSFHASIQYTSILQSELIVRWKERSAPPPVFWVSPSKIPPPSNSFLRNLNSAKTRTQDTQDQYGMSGVPASLPAWGNLPLLESLPRKDADDQTSNSLLDREERAVAALLTRYKNLVTLAAMPAGDGATKEVAASHAFQMEVESNALVRPFLSFQDGSRARLMARGPGSSSGRSPTIDPRAEGIMACWSSESYW